MKRRDFILTSVSGLLIVASPLAAQQRAAVSHVGILNYAADDDIRVRQFREALAKLGYVDGRNLTIMLRSANGIFEHLPGLANELVTAKVDAIIALGPAAFAARNATTMIPIIVAFSGDMVEMGVVESLARPGGNITGFSYMSSDLAGKRLELLSNAIYKSSRIGVLYNPLEPATQAELAATEAAAITLKVVAVPIATRTTEELDVAFRSAKSLNLDGVIVLTHGFAVLNRTRIIELAAHYRVPTLHGWRDFVAEGGLMSYGPDIEVLVRGAARHVDRILRGAKPAELPVEQPTRLLLSINLKAAAALEMTFSPAILLSADEVVE